MTLSKDEYKALQKKCAGTFRYALKTGKVQPLAPDAKCVDCGARATMQDHRNYYKPLEVEPVCRKCNSSRGQAYPYCDEWGKRRVGIDIILDDEPIDYDCCLAVDFDFGAYDEHIEYMRIFEVDPDVQKLDRFKSIKVGRGYTYKCIEGRLYKFGVKWNKVLKKTMYGIIEDGGEQGIW